MKHLLPILAIFILLFQSILTLDGGYLSTKVQQAIIDSKFSPFLEYPKQETSEEPNFGHLPVAFVPNRGQVQDSSVSFQVTHLTGSTFFKPGEFELILPNQSEPEIASFDNTKATKQKKEPSRLLVQYKNYNNKALVRGINPLPGKANYFYGNDSSQWFTDVETYQGILYEDLYPNIDLVIGGGAGYIKSSLIIAPGADPSLINWKYRGAQDIIIDQQGNLQITAKSKGDPQYFFETAPIAWQTVHGENLSVQVAYQIENNQHISFIFPEGYDTTKELIIDPTLKWGASTKNIPVTTEATLEWGTYIGNNGTDQGFGIDHDSAGNVLVTGYSYCWYYPLVDPIQEQTGEEEIIISKLDPTGSYLLYSTCLGGTGTDKANSIALDQQDNIILVGETDSSDFPIVSGISAYAGGNKDAFVVKINSTGNAVTYSSYMGGSNEERAASVAVDPNGFIYLVGETGSSNFPTTTNAYDRVFGGGTCDGIKCKDIFVAKFDSSLSDLNSILYSTYIGGANRVDKGYDLALDPNNNVYITGYTFTLSGFPLVNAVQGSNNGGSDAFIIKMDLNQSGNNSILFSTYFGGSSNDRGYGIAVDGSGNAYLTGYTESSNFPTMNPYQAEQGGGCSSECSDAYIAKLNTTTSQIVYSSYLGGAGIDEANDVVVNNDGMAYIVGFTKSSNFPVVNPLFGRSIDGCSSAPCADAFVTVFDQTCASLVFSTYLGGEGEDVAKALVIDPEGNLFVTGYSFSDDFPVSSGAYNPSNPENNLKSDVFVAKINSIIPTPTPTETSSFTDTPVPPTPTTTATITETPTQPTSTFTVTPTVSNTPTPTPTQEPLLAWTAESNIEFAHFGWSVSTAGDINGDSYDDVVIGAPHYSNGQTNEGAIYLYYGSEDGLGTTPVIIESNEPESLFGWSVSTAGDVNGDGFDDLIIGAIGCTSPEQCEGRAYVFYGTSDGLSATPGWSTMGGKAHSAYGYTVGSAGDVNGDGFGDVFVGAPNDGNNFEGKVYVYYGALTGDGGLSATPSWSASGGQNNAYFGLSASSAGDVNGDQIDDLIVGAPNASTDLAGEGKAHIFFGHSGGLLQTASWTVEGDQLDAHFGESVSGVGDLNGDGQMDVVVGAPDYDDGSTADAGAAFVYFGVSGSGPTAQPGWSERGSQAGMNFGISVTGAGDVDNDMLADLLIGANRYSNGEEHEGRVLLHFGSAGGIDPNRSWAMEGGQAFANLGYAISKVFVIQPGSAGAILFAAPQMDNNEADEGLVFFYSGLH